MKKIQYLLWICFLITSLSEELHSQNLINENIKSGGPASTTNSNFESVGSLSIDVTAVDKVLVVATFSSKTTTGSATGYYRIADVSDAANLNSGVFELTHNSFDNNGSVSYIFDVGAFSGIKTYDFQHRTSAQTIQTEINMTAIALSDGAVHLPADVQQLNTDLEVSGSNWITVVESKANVLSHTGGFYVTASIQNQRTSGGASMNTGAEWVLQYKLNTETSENWRNLNFPVQRQPLNEFKGIITLVGALPDATEPGSYDFRVAQRKTEGPHTMITQKCNLVTIPLGTINGFFPVFTTSKPTANTTSSSMQPILQNNVNPQSNTDIFLLSQYALQANGQALSPAYEIIVNKNNSIFYQGLQHKKSLANSSHKCSGASSALIKNTEQGVTYSIRFNHASANSRSLTTSDVLLAGFGLYKSSKSFVLPVTVNSTLGLGNSSYNTLTSAFNDINSGIFRGNITVLINSNIIETSSVILQPSGQGNTSYSQILLYPTNSNLSVTGDINGPLVDFSGAKNITFDGRANLIGNASLTFENINVQSGSRTFRFINSAENNILRNCNILGSTPSTTGGIIHFGASSIGPGNSGITIENCNISSSDTQRPLNAIYSNGSSGRRNSNINIRNNNIFNIFNPESSSNGIHIAGNTQTWTLLGNSFYETQKIDATGVNEYYAIRIDAADVNDFTIRNNFIGGSAPECAGNPLVFSTATGSQFKGIYIRTSDTELTEIKENVFQNFNFTSTHPNPWDAIYAYSGSLLIEGNIIGLESATGNIKITSPTAYLVPKLSGGSITSVEIIGGGYKYNEAPAITFHGSGSNASATAEISNGSISSVILNNGGSGYDASANLRLEGFSTNFSTVHGIRLFTQGDVKILNNTIASFELESSDYYAIGFEGIYKDVNRGGNLLIENNQIGSLSHNKSIHIKSSASQAVTGQRLYGIFHQGSQAVQINNNLVAGLYNSYSGNNNATATFGIYATRGKIDIASNRVFNLATEAGNGGGAQNASIIGIAIQNTTAGISHTIIANEVVNLNNHNPSARVDLHGIYLAGANNIFHEVSGNYVSRLQMHGINKGSSINGILLFGGKTNFYNNIVFLGENYHKQHFMYGVYDQGAYLSDLNAYHNTIRIVGTAEAGSIASSYAFYNRANSTTPRNILNNVFTNTRTGGSDGKHYAIRTGSISNLNINYNSYFTGLSFLSQFNNTDVLSLTNWKTSTLQDENSYDQDPGFINTGNGYEMHYFTNTLTGATTTGITSDFSGQNRSVITPSIGALELNEVIWTGNISTDFNTAANWSGNLVPETGANIRFSAEALHNCILDQNRLIGSIQNSGNKDLVLNGKNLKISGFTHFTGIGKMDGGSENSKIIFNGPQQQFIQKDLFKNDEIQNLEIQNPKGILMQGYLKVLQSLNIKEGDLLLSDQTLQLNGNLLCEKGTIKGGNQAALLIKGGNENIMSLPALNLRKLHLDRITEAVRMTGNLTIHERIDLQNGLLITGNHILTIKADSIYGNGTIDAAESGAHLIFQNPNNLVLSENILSETIDQLSIQGGGLQSAGNMSIVKSLNLNAPNPTSKIGLLHMQENHILTMEAQAITTGFGDVSGQILRKSVTPNTDYTFGSAYTNIKFTNGSDAQMPQEVLFIVRLDTTNIIKTNTVRRIYEIIRTGGQAPTRFNLTLRYLESELNGHEKDNLVFWDHHVPYNGLSPHEHGKSAQNYLNNTITLASHGIGYLVTNAYVNEIEYVDEATTPQNQSKIWMISGKESTSDFEWIGADDVVWANNTNWSGGAIPTATSDVVIRAFTPYPAFLPAEIELNSITILPGATLGALENSRFIINGSININNGNVSWNNQGVFEPNNSTVVFTSTAAAISGQTHFYNLEIAENAKLSIVAGSRTQISNDVLIKENGSLNATAMGENTFEYTGNKIQNIVNTSNGAYHHLLLSGSGAKNLPLETNHFYGDLSLYQNAELRVVNDLNIDGNLKIVDQATFEAGGFTHYLKGDIEINGSLTTESGSKFIFDGSKAQYALGDKVLELHGIQLKNEKGLFASTDLKASGMIDMENGNLHLGDNAFYINAGIQRTETSQLVTGKFSSLHFGGSMPLAIPDNLFADNYAELNNVIIDCAGGITTNNQRIVVNGLLNLNDGFFNIAGKKISINGSITRNTGKLLTDGFTEIRLGENASLLILPHDVFSNSSTEVGVLSVERSGGLNLGNQNILIGNKLVLKNGIIHQTSLAGLTIFSHASTVGTDYYNEVPGSELSFINGKVEKLGNTAFIFPVGAESIYAPIGISAPKEAGAIDGCFSASYTSKNPDDLYDTRKFHESLVRVSNMEYWTIDKIHGDHEVKVSLNWDDRSGGITDISKLMVARWDGEKWANHGNTNTSGDLEKGFVTSDYVKSFSPFTLASNDINSNPLPIELLFFKTNCADAGVNISWATESEINNDYFSIEKSFDLKSWEEIVIVSGSGTSKQRNDYHYFFDGMLSDTHYYYRLKQTDYDGTTTHSAAKTTFCRFNHLSQDLVLYPNPSEAQFKISGLYDEKAIISIFDHTGIKIKSFYAESADNLVIDLSFASSGLYFIKVNTTKGSKVFKAIKL
ncbi:MAG: T9SS type A sorting domain-containing protein [Cyclobacteriaceae bacterium]|nr:T9SS type A sorting domain-containing protein [Cyclobacteriaceae bacterium]